MEKDLNCKICNEKFESQRRLCFHLTKHHPEIESYESYVIKFYFNGIHPECKCDCGTKMKFESFNPNFFKEYAQNHFPRKPHTEETKEKIRENSKKAIKEKYGVDNIMELQEFIDKIGDTKEQRYENRNYNNIDKQTQTFIKRYGDAKYRNTEQMMQTNRERFNAPTFTATPEGKAQVKATKLKNHGDENYVNIEKIRETKLRRHGYGCEFEQDWYRRKHNSNNSEIEKRVIREIGAILFNFKGHQFDGNLDNFIIEIDGAAHHTKNMSEMNIPQLGSKINDFRKTNKVNDSEFELIRVDPINLKKLKRTISFEDVWENCYEQDFSFNFFTKFATKEYLKNLIEKKGKDKLLKYWRIFSRFIKEFQPEFPKYETTETFEKVTNFIHNYKFDKILKNKTFNNNSSITGISYLKANFDSYWKSSFKDSKSPVDSWKDPKIMERVIKYRIGLNNSGEVFDFSLHQMIRGLSACRHTISFFKPVLAAAIYKHFLTDIENPIVFDPCCGFGGRLLGFKSLYPNGTYFGCEPNPETFNELVKLSKNFSNVHLFNCKLEDFDLNQLPEDIDLSFTSIPYFDLETYSNPTEYLDIEEWKETFIQKLKSVPNLLVNVPMDLRNCFDLDCEEYFISSNTSHFNKNQKIKFEFLLDFRK